MDQKEIKDLMRAFDKSGLSKFKLKKGDFEISFQKGIKQQAEIAVLPQTQASQPQTQAPSKEQQLVTSDSDKAEYIKSPMVGTFYQAPSPGAAPFVQPGDMVKKGSTVAIIEAMKIMNEIEAEFDCKIVEVLVNNGEPVEFDQPLFLVEKL